ncbi:MAG: divergent PAP2 family protein [Candidatus Margulisiibacteriota bacterium]|nr:divergent PAP2 family protein [Candidatus Margulisiibacteriota bacterium]
MNLIIDLFTNVPLVAGGAAFLFSQVFKVFFYLIKDKELNFWHFFESAGMPSTHSAMTSALTISIGITQGFFSPFFALSLVFTIVVMYDAMGVRFAAGQQALILNKIIEDIYSEKVNEKEKLKELIGHTPFEVFVGGLLGLLIGMLYTFIMG